MCLWKRHPRRAWCHPAWLLALTVASVCMAAGPSQIEVDESRTSAGARSEPVRPGGELRIYGSFPWNRDATRAKAYFLPRDQPAPASFEQRFFQALQKQGFAGTTRSASPTEAVFVAPDNDRILMGSGKTTKVRVIVVDEPAAGAPTIGQVMFLDAADKEFPTGMVLGSAVVLVAGVGLLVVLLIVGVVVLIVLARRRRPARQ